MCQVLDVSYSQNLNRQNIHPSRLETVASCRVCVPRRSRIWTNSNEHHCSGSLRRDGVQIRPERWKYYLWANNPKIRWFLDFPETWSIDYPESGFSACKHQ
jgi:hypothetical protein